MKLSGFGFSTTQWNAVAPTQHAGVTGMATWRTCHFGGAEPHRSSTRLGATLFIVD